MPDIEITSVLEDINVQLLPFSGNIVFDRPVTRYADHVVTSPVEFAVSGQNGLTGAIAICRIVADGVNTPTFAGIKQLSGSSGYINISGVLNMIQFMFDGVEAWYSIAQELVLPPVYTDTDPPALQSITSEPDGSRVYLNYDEDLFQSVPSPSDFVLSSGVISNITISQNRVTLQLSTPFSDPATLSYTPGNNKLQDPFNNVATSFATQPVNFTSGSAAQALAFTERTSNIAADGSGTFTATAADPDTTFMLADQKIATGEDGYISWQYSTKTTAASNFVGFNTTDINNSYKNALGNGYEYYAWVNSSNSLNRGGGGGGSPGPSGASVAVGDWIRMRRESGTIMLETSPDESTWTLAYTFPTVSTIDLFPAVSMGEVEFTNPKIFGGVDK